MCRPDFANACAIELVALETPDETDFVLDFRPFFFLTLMLLRREPLGRSDAPGEGGRAERRSITEPERGLLLDPDRGRALRPSDMCVVVSVSDWGQRL